MKQFNRRTLLKGLGVCMALPTLDVMAQSTVDKKRFVAIDLCLGLHPESFFPKETGKNYKESLYLEKIKQHRNDFTVFSGANFPKVNGGHSDFQAFLTGAPNPGSSSFKNSISIDQYAAAKLGEDTRYNYLALSTRSGTLSYSGTGIPVPAVNKSENLFKQLFLQGKKWEVERQLRSIQQGQSIMDTVNDQAKRLNKHVSKADKVKLDEYFTTVRDTEKRLIKAESWVNKPKPKVDLKPFKNKKPEDIVGKMNQFFTLMHLALETDQTRFMTFYIDGMNGVAPIAGVNAGYHNLSHHGKDPSKIKQLQLIELAIMSEFNSFLAKIKKSNLLDSTTVLFGSHLGNGNNHSTKSLPIVLAGGGFKHGQHIAFTEEEDYPLSNLYVSIL